MIILDTTTNSICGGNSGTILVTPTGGTSPFSYIWQDNAFLDTNYRDGLSAGQYTVQVTDFNNCIGSSTITVIDNGAGVFNLVGTNDANCYGESTGEIIVGINGGTPDFTYVIHINGLLVDSFVTSNTIDTVSNLSNGTYSIIIYDQYGCVTQPGSANVGQPNELITSDSLIDVSCFNGNNGMIILTTTGGTPNYSYSWSNSETTSTVSSLVSDSYTVTIIDSHSCEEIHNYTITQPTAPNTITFTNTGNVDCYGNSTGFAIAQMNDGTAPYSYSWTNGSTDSTAQSLIEGEYFVTITDINNCIAIDSISITQPTAIDLTISNVTNASCYNDSTGAISINVDGGTVEYSYLWSNGDTIADLNNIPSGNYTLTLTDANNCSDTVSAVILNPTQLVLTDSVKEIEYAGFISLYVNGGTEPYSYTWSNDATTSTNEYLSSGDYYVTVTDANGCTILNSYSIEIPLIVPSVITPNNDGKNDYFNITNIETVDNVKINVFNRWGDLIFSFNDEGAKYKEQDSQWDGTDLNGNILPIGSYVYIIEIEGELEPYKGTVTIIR